MKKISTIIIISLLCLSMFSMLMPSLKVQSTNETTTFSDSFESYAVGTFPSSGGWELVWNGMGDQYQVITDAYYVSPTKSLQLWGNPNDWSAVVQKHFSSTSRFIGYEVSMLVSAVGYGGPGRVDYVGFFNREAYVWGKYYATVQFNHDTMNIITDDGSVVGTWTTGTWYSVKVLLDRTTNTYSVWINGQLKGTDFKTSNQDTNIIDAFSLQSDHPGVKDYFDDVRVFESSGETGLVGYWKLDEGSGNIAHDSSGNGNDGTVNGASWTAGISNGALQFDGISNYVGIPSSPSLTLSGNQVSLELWIKPTITLNSSLASRINIMDKGDGYGFQMEANDARINFFVNIGYADQWLSSETSDWKAGTWYHIAGTYDGTNESIYVNGALENTKSLSGTLSGIGDPLSIGSYCYGTMNFFNGAIDEVKIYNYARTAEEIQNDYNSVAPASGTLNVNVFDESGFSPPSATGFQKLAEVKVKIYDAASNLIASGQSGNDGTVTFNLDPGVYTVQYGGCLYRYITSPQSSDLAHYGACLPDSAQVTVAQGSNQLNLYVAGLLFHEYQWGSDGGDPFQLNYVDLNSATADHETSITVSPGQTVQAVASFWELETINVPVWWASVFGDWNPTTALANLAEGVASPSSHNLHTVPFTFTAPTQPGTYHIRVNGALDYDWCNSYYTGMHPNPRLGRDMGNNIISNINIDTSSRDITGNYGTGTIIVGGQPDFNISVSPQQAVADPKSPTIFAINVTSLYGFNQLVTLSAVYSSHELSGSFGDTAVTPPSDGSVTTTLTVSVLSEAINTHQIYITGTSGTLSHTKTVSLHVPFLSVPYFSQGDTPWCGPTSIAMVMRFYGVSVHPWDVATSLGLTHDDAFNALLHYPTLRTYLTDMGLTSELYLYPLSLGTLKDMLQESEPVILGFQFVPPGSILPAGHAIVITGYYNDGTEDMFFVNDPGNVMYLLFGLGSYYGPNAQLEIRSSDLLPYVLDLFSYIIEIKGASIPSTGVLSLIGGKPEQAGSSFAFSHGTTSPWSYDVYVWEQGKPGILDTPGITWKNKYPHPCWLDPEDYLRVVNYPYGWIVNPTDKSRSYKFEMVFSKPGLTLPPITIDVSNVAPCSWANPNYPSTKIKDILGQNYGRYTITLKLLTEDGLLLDQIDLPTIKYATTFKVSLGSPATLFVTDPLGRSIGFDPTSGEFVNQIPDATYLNTTESQIIMILDPINGSYNIQLHGTGNGSYTLTTELVTYTGTAAKTYSGQISAGEIQTLVASISGTELALNIPSPTHLWIYIVLTGIVMAVAIVVFFAARKSKALSKSLHLAEKTT